LKVRFQADADLRRTIIAGLRRREPTIDFRTLMMLVSLV